MKPKVIVVGAGITGASIAFRLAQGGADVTVIEAAGIAAAASGRSFGWINASFYASPDHFRLRLAGIEAWRRLSAAIGPTGVEWSGCLWWEETGAAFAAVEAELTAFGYPCKRLDRAAFARLEPAIAAPPEESLLFPGEGAVDLAAASDRLLAAAAMHGARLLLGVPVTGFLDRSGGVSGVITAHGAREADLVITATGTATEALLAGIAVELPMLDRPGVLLRTRPADRLIRHILVSPGQELRQTPEGHILAPTSASHQRDRAEALSEPPGDLADQTLRRLAALLPGAPLRVERAIVGWRPVPADGLPAVGAAGIAGLYVATMHSGATLGPLIGELVASEILTGRDAPELARFRPGRFG